MVKVLILSHGGLAAELLETARRIACDTGTVSSLCLDWNDDPKVHRQRLGAVVDRLGPDEELLILTDMYGGTPHNIAAGFAAAGKVEVLAGVNLPMVVRLCCRDEGITSAGELARWIQRKGRSAICACRTKNPRSGEPGADGG